MFLIDIFLKIITAYYHSSKPLKTTLKITKTQQPVSAMNRIIKIQGYVI